MARLIVAIFLLGLASIDKGYSEKFTRSIESETNILWPNSIHSNHVYQQIKLKQQKKVDNFNGDDDELLRKMLSDTSVPLDIEKFDSIGDRVIARANVSEETKRVVRQVKKQRPGFFWTLFRVLFETVNETRLIIQQINDVVTQNVREEKALPKIPPVSSTPNINENELSNMTTTEAPFKLTRQYLQDFVRKNIRGLVRLFNIEWKDALNQSQTNIKKFQKDLSKSAAPFLTDNPNVY